jgi:hypothetical protein
MIRKFLVCGKKQVYLQSKNIDSYHEIGKVIELLIPIKDFWVIEKYIKEVNYLIASGEAQAEISSSYRKVLLASAKFAVKEIDRTWLYGRKQN